MRQWQYKIKGNRILTTSLNEEHLARVFAHVPIEVLYPRLAHSSSRQDKARLKLAEFCWLLMSRIVSALHSQPGGTEMP